MYLSASKSKSFKFVNSCPCIQHLPLAIHYLTHAILIKKKEGFKPRERKQNRRKRKENTSITLRPRHRNSTSPPPLSVYRPPPFDVVFRRRCVSATFRHRCSPPSPPVCLREGISSFVQLL